MTPTDMNDSGLGGPGIWDQMPLVPPTKAPQEVDDSKLIWSKPLTATALKATSKPKPTTKRAAKKAARKTAKAKKKTKKIAGRSKRR